MWVGLRCSVGGERGCLLVSLGEWEESAEVGGGLEGREVWPRFVMKRITVEVSWRWSDLGSTLVGVCGSEGLCRELTVKEE